MCSKYKHVVLPILVMAFMTMGICVSSLSSAAAQDSVKGSSATAESAHASRHSGQLGVIVSSSPKGVHVVAVIPGGPAAKAGIRQGDYIMDINDEDMSTPQELQKKIQSLTEFDTIDVTLWREGQDVNVSVGLAGESKLLTDAHRTWLGVMLSPTSDGMKVDLVHPDSPADVAGLLEGDVITKVDGKEVKAADQLAKTVQELGPSHEIKLTVLRDGKEQSLTATLGTIDDAPMAWFYQLESHPEAATRVMEQVLDELRAEIQALKNDVQKLKSKSTNNNNDVSQRSQGKASGIVFVAQHERGGYGAHGGRGYYDGHGYYGGHNYYGGSYHGFGRVLGGNYGYGAYPGYSPYYRSGIPFSYYSFGGRPYFYGGYSPYLYRGGVRIGPNFSVWW
ncbi:MAG: PDZ domain-containing protein [Planctomycetales bacterium]|nr:PDZ domain-containing protein [Planctomycetales bacterium]